MYQFRLGFSHHNAHLSLCTFMIYDKDDALYDPLEAVIDCPLRNLVLFGNLSPLPPSSVLLESEPLCMLTQGENHDELLIDNSLQSTFH